MVSKTKENEEKLKNRYSKCSKMMDKKDFEKRNTKKNALGM